MTQQMDPQERRRAFLDVALALFQEKGYDKTTINDIINQMGVSKGAFYHYFQSKEDVIEQISDHYAERVIRMADQMADLPDVNAIEKVNRLFQLTQGYKRDSREKRSMIKRIFQNEDNLKLERKILQKLRFQMRESITKIIQQGIREGHFRKTDPREMAEFFQFVIQGLNTSTEEIVQAAYQETPVNQEKLEEKLSEKLAFYEETLALLFQVPAGTIHLKEAYLNRYLER